LLHQTFLPLLYIGGVIACFIWIVVVYLYNDVLSGYGFIISGIFWLIFYFYFEYRCSWFRVNEQRVLFNVALSWRSIGGLGISVVLILAGYNSGWAVLAGGALSMFLAGAIILYYYDVSGLRVDNWNSIFGDKSRAVLSFAIPAALSNIVIIGLSQADRYIISSLLGNESVAIYSANYDLAEKFVFFGNSLILLSSSVTGFKIFEMEGEAKASEFLSGLMRIYLLSATPIVGVFAILAPFFVGIVLPESYSQGAYVIPIIAFSGLIVGILHRYTLILSFHRRSDLVMWSSGLALMVNISLCIYSIPLFGLIGAALSTAVSYFCWLIFSRVLVAKYMKPKFPLLTFFRVCFSLAVALAGLFMFLYISSNPGIIVLVSSGLVSLIIYVPMLYLMGELSNSDIKKITDTFGKRFVKG